MSTEIQSFHWRGKHEDWPKLLRALGEYCAACKIAVDRYGDGSLCQGCAQLLRNRRFLDRLAFFRGVYDDPVRREKFL